MGGVLGKDGLRPDAGQVGAGTRLGHRDRQHEVAGDAAGDPALLLLLGPEVQEVRQDDVGVRHRGADGRSGPGDLLGEHRTEVVAGLGAAAVLLRHLHTEQAQLAELAVEVAGNGLRLDPALEVRDGFLGEELPDHLPEGLVLLVERRA